MLLLLGAFCFRLWELVQICLCKEKTDMIMLNILGTSIVGAMQVAKEA